MENEENNMDFLDLDDDTPVETLPETTPFAAPRPRKPWMLMGLGLVVIVLATYIIIRTIGGDSSRSVEINLDAPEVVSEPEPVVVPAPSDTLNVPARPVAVAPVPTPVQPAPQPVVQPKPVQQPVVETNGVPVRVVSDRRDVTFKPVAKSVQKSAPIASGKWFVQFGSYATRAAAESAERKMRNGHASLFNGKQFVILAAQLPNGKTTYRLRISFATSSDANGFCQNAKSDGLDCYVAR